MGETLQGQANQQCMGKSCSSTDLQASRHLWGAVLGSCGGTASGTLQKMPYGSRTMRLRGSSSPSFWGEPCEQAQQGQQHPCSAPVRSHGQLCPSLRKAEPDMPETSQASAGNWRHQSRAGAHVPTCRQPALGWQRQKHPVAAPLSIPASEPALEPRKDLYSTSSRTSLLHNSYLFSRR